MTDEQFFKVQDLCEGVCKAILDQSEFPERGNWASAEDYQNMTLVDLLEMLCGWAALGVLSERVAALAPSEPKLWILLHNTCVAFGWFPEKKEIDDAHS